MFICIKYQAAASSSSDSPQAPPVVDLSANCVSKLLSQKFPHLRAAKEIVIDLGFPTGKKENRRPRA